MTIEAKKENGSLTITLEGEINNMAAPKFEKAYLDNREDIREVCIDMEKATLPPRSRHRPCRRPPRNSPAVAPLSSALP